jgi:hypothetical protein
MIGVWLLRDLFLDRRQPETVEDREEREKETREKERAD